MENKLNFFLIGRTGQGKSSTGNTILKQKAFLTTATARCTSVTKKVSYSLTDFDRYKLQVVDGPGLEDTELRRVEDIKAARENMLEALQMCFEGVHAFLFVIKYGYRMHGNDKSALETLRQVFGSTYFDHVIVVITCGDLFQADMEEEALNDITFHDWCKQQKGELCQLYKDFEGRFVLVNNREKDENKKQAKIQEIVLLTLKLREKHGTYHITPAPRNQGWGNWICCIL